VHVVGAVALQCADSRSGAHREIRHEAIAAQSFTLTNDWAGVRLDMEIMSPAKSGLSSSQARGHGIQSVERAMQILDVLREIGGSARLTELAAHCGMGKSTAHHLLDTLVGTGHVARVGRQYCLGARLALLAAQPADGYTQRLRRAFAPALRAFSAMTGQNCFLTMPGGTRSYLTLAALDGHGEPLSLPPDARRDALLTSAVGKVFLAHDGQLLRRLRRNEALGAPLENELARVNAQGYALDIGASAPDLNCVALPLRLRGNVVAALSAGGAAAQLGPRQMRATAARAMRELFDVIKL